MIPDRLLNIAIYPHHPNCNFILESGETGSCNCTRQHVQLLINEVIRYREDRRRRVRETIEELVYTDEATWAYLKVMEPLKLAAIRDWLNGAQSLAPDGSTGSESTGPTKNK